MSIVPLFSTLTKVFAAAAAASAASVFLFIDANPSLYFYDCLVCTDRHLTRRLCGKRVWITGASSGIGTELALQLSKHGASVILSGRNRVALNRVAERCQQRQSTSSKQTNVLVLPFNATEDDESLEQTVATALDRWGGIDILVLNAGRSQLGPAMATSTEVTRELMDLNYVSPVRLALMLMRRDAWESRPRGDGGHIVVTSSVAAKMAVPLSSSYAASKHAVNGFFSSLRSEHPSLRVDLPCPGPVDTAIGANAYTAIRRQEQSDASARTATEGSSSQQGSKMSADRCARLIISGMVGPPSLFYETWIQKQPVLSFSFLSQYSPGLANQLLRRVGSLRLVMWQNGLPLYASSSWKKASSILKEQLRTKKS